MMTLRKTLNTLSLLFFMFYMPLTSLKAEDGLKIQLVLESRDKKSAIPYEIADHIVKHLEHYIAPISFSNILRGKDKIILTFVTTNKAATNIPSAIAAMKNLEKTSSVKVETWRKETTTLPDEMVSDATNTDANTESTDNKESKQFTKWQAGEESGNENPIKQTNDGLFTINKQTVTVELILKSIATTTDFEYICPQSIGSKLVAINCHQISKETLLSILKLSLNLSIKKTGSIVIFVNQH